MENGLKADYKYDPKHFNVTDEMLANYEKYGYLMIRGFLDNEEISQVRKTLKESDMCKTYGYKLTDGTGKAPKFVIWGHPGNDVTGMIARSEKVVNLSEKLLGGEVYHYHAKLVNKEPEIGGGLLWHQDYGYWYQNGNLFPQLLTTIFAVDRCDTTNGCVQILPGSHKCGRVDHGMHGDAGQHQADPERVQQLENTLGRTTAVMEPGDCLIIHANLLHVSGPNTSTNVRRTLLFTYNRKSNNPVYEHHHPQYTPLEKVPNSAIKTCTNYTDLSGKDFLDPAIDKTVKAKREN